MSIVPFKLNQDRRHHILRQRRTVTDWPVYDASLRQRGSLTVWFTDEAVAAWAAEPRTEPHRVFRRLVGLSLYAAMGMGSRAA